MVLYLGYCALVLIAIYFTVGFLKISGEGLAQLGYPNNFIREGFEGDEEDSAGAWTAKQKKSLKNQNEQLERLIKMYEDQDIEQKMEERNDDDTYIELISNMKKVGELMMKSEVQDFIGNGTLWKKPNQDRIAGIQKTLSLIENYTI